MASHWTAAELERAHRQRARQAARRGDTNTEIRELAYARAAKSHAHRAIGQHKTDWQPGDTY